ncbi:T9SS type A sorting domain-containing protein, partial [Crocinitomicaceae bacterium]|nr:T9SS type A sorting domain-containing protein [Crocinitomicaceae bacterium]
MRYSIFTLFLLLSTASFCQLEFTHDGQILDQSNPNTITIYNQAPTDIYIRNTSNDTVKWTFGQCQLVDNPDLGQDAILWTSESTPFGIGLQNASITYPCFDLQSSPTITYPNEKTEYRVYFSVNNTGCESYRLKITDYTSGAYIDSIDLNFCSVLGLEEEGLELVQLYPNPVSDELTIEGEVDKISIFASDGQLIRSQHVSNLDGVSTINVAELKTGMYIIESTATSGELIRQS